MWIFFFKQKTAYEMRISDWSSDVCSSDLENTWEQIAMFFPGLTREDLPDGEGWAVEMLSLSTHNGTHMDAPWHYHSTTDNGASPAPSIDEPPLHLFFRPGLNLDFQECPTGHVLSSARVVPQLARNGHDAHPRHIKLSN